MENGEGCPSSRETDDDDLALLPDLDEDILLERLNARYRRHGIYTYVGDILLAVNPFKAMPLYDEKACQRYRNLHKRSSLPPHVFAVGDHMYRAMRSSEMDQVCVISGESGAGKTETAKLLVKQILHVSRSIRSDLQAQILKVNPLLEALGNARTVMNNNSSRFGKFLKLHFNENAVVTGASIAHYLLEKSRVVTQNEGERNFHIFYLMFAGLSQQEKSKYELMEPEDYRYLFNPKMPSSRPTAREVTEMTKFFQEVRDAMTVVGFDDDDFDSIFTVLSAVLNLGQLDFVSSRSGHAEFSSRNVLVLVAELLSIEPSELARALTVQVTTTRGETINKPNTVEQASEFTRSLAKYLYGLLFAWVVKSLNLMLSPSLSAKAAQQLSESDTFRGTDLCILDIFGFENFRVNSFEQFCINVANEQLQYYFNQHIFRWEQEEYEKEGVSSPGSFEFADNRPIIDLFFARPTGMFNLLDDETKFPRSSAKTLVDKFNEHCDKNPHYVKSKRQNEPSFTVKHYAADVKYQCEAFLDKNRDALSAGLLECIKGSRMELLQSLLLCSDDVESERVNPSILLECESTTQRMRNNRLVSKVLRKKAKRGTTRNSGRRRDSRRGSVVKAPLESTRNSGRQRDSRRGSVVKAPLERTPSKLLVVGRTSLSRTKSNGPLSRHMSLRTIRQRHSSRNVLMGDEADSTGFSSGGDTDTENDGTGVEWVSETMFDADATSPDTTGLLRSPGDGSRSTLASAELDGADRTHSSKQLAAIPNAKLGRPLLKSSTLPQLPLSPANLHCVTLPRKSSLSVCDSLHHFHHHRRSTLRKRRHAPPRNEVDTGLSGRAAIKASLRSTPRINPNIAKKAPPTIGFYFKSSLASLMEKMLISMPHFIRCLKPNNLLLPDSFDKQLMLQQLRYTGVMETTRIRQLGYPTRLDFPSFIERYRFLLTLDEDVEETAEKCAELLDRVGLSDYAMGNSKVFLRYHHNETLFNLQDRLINSAVVVQKYVRGFLARRYAQRLFIEKFCDQALSGCLGVHTSLTLQAVSDQRHHQEELERKRLERERQEVVRLQKEAEDRQRAEREQQELERIERMRREQERFQRIEQEQLERKRREEQAEIERQERLAEVERSKALRAKSVVKTLQALDEANEVHSCTNWETRSRASSAQGEPAATSTRKRKLASLQISNGLQDELQSVKTEIGVVEFETEEANLSLQNVGQQTQATLAEADSLRTFSISSPGSLSRLSASESYGDASPTSPGPQRRKSSKRPWCVVTIMEREHTVGSYSLYPRLASIDGSESMSSTCIGLNCNPTVSNHDSVRKVRPYIGKGIDLEINSDGSVLATRRSKNCVIIKGRSETLLNCHGNPPDNVLPRDKPTELFSAQKFKQHVKACFSASKLDLTVLFCLCRVGISFVRDTAVPATTPCWAILDFVVPHLKVNEYLRRKELKTDRTGSPWMQSGLYDVGMSCFTPPANSSSSFSQYTSLARYTSLRRQESSRDSYSTTSSLHASESSTCSDLEVYHDVAVRQSSVHEVTQPPSSPLGVRHSTDSSLSTHSTADAAERPAMYQTSKSLLFAASKARIWAKRSKPVSDANSTPRKSS